MAADNANSRRRKKRCDRGFPVCGHCIRLNLACEREQPRRFVAGNTSGSCSSSSSWLHDVLEPTGDALIHRHADQVGRIYYTATDAALLHDARKGDIVASRRSVLRYYTSVFSSILSTNHENNCFLSGNDAFSNHRCSCIDG